MDIYCVICGEPYDTDSIHEIAEERDISFNEAFALWKKEGCTAFPGGSHSEPYNSEAAQKSAILHDLLGDDIDAIAGFSEDFDL